LKNQNTIVQLAAALSLACGTAALAQTSQPANPSDPVAAHSGHAQHAAQPSNAPGADQNKALVDQIAELRAQVARLEAAMAQGHRAMSQPMPQSGPMQPGGMQGMAGMGGGGMMGMMNQMMSGEMGGMGMGQPSSGGVNMPGGGMAPGMGMERMMGMGKMGQMPMPGMLVSALPGFPGASHIYHVGATGFFLDHPEHITLSTEQQTRLGQIREKAMMDQASDQRKIEQAEQELWDLTASDTPDAAKIEAKVREVEKLRGDQRLSFIRAVGSAAAVLTDEQRKQLTGMLPPAPPPAPQQPPAQGGGSDHM
jgi:Spy/CpxP family protein refolding chaperone